MAECCGRQQIVWHWVLLGAKTPATSRRLVPAVSPLVGGWIRHLPNPAAQMRGFTAEMAHLVVGVGGLAFQHDDPGAEHTLLR